MRDEDGGDGEELEEDRGGGGWGGGVLVELRAQRQRLPTYLPPPHHDNWCILINLGMINTVLSLSLSWG